MADNLGYSIFLDPKDAVRAWEMRAPLKPTVRWTEMMHEQHATAFTVAKVAKLDLLRQIQTSLDSVIRSGGTLEEWKKGLVPELQKAGWWGTVANKELTGTDQPIIVNERRLRTIYDTNVRMSLSAGHWARIQAQKDVLPYLRYLPSSSERKRPLHMSWYGTLLPVDDEWWQTHFPPNGWFCKCHFEQVSERKMRKMGWSITPVEQIAGGPSTKWEPAGGGVFQVPAGIDNGFSFNPGTAHLRAVADKAASSIQQALDAGLEAAARKTVREIVDDAAFEQFFSIPQGRFPIAVLTKEQREMIDGSSQLVVIPMKIMKKQKEGSKTSRGHSDLNIAAYRMLPDIVENAIVIIAQGDTKVIFMANRDTAGKSRWWKVIIRQDEGEPTPAIVSFQPADDRELRREAGKGEIVKDLR
jgi:hypothetical protein